MIKPKECVAVQRSFFRKGKTRDVSYRIDQLKKLKDIIKQHEDDILAAIKKDFRKPEFESYGTEVGILYSEIDHILRHIKKWSKPERVWGSFLNFPSKNYIYPQPYGVSLVIGAWNYPFQLSLSPVLGSMAAGNCTVIKPSEISEHSSALLTEMINSSFEPGYLRVVEGDAETTQKLLDQPLDTIFFTGSTRVGKIIMKKAAEQLTPVTLELGGKSPAVIDESANLEVAARRIAWGKFLNAGQTCVAPDYVYIQEEVKDRFLHNLQHEITEFYGSDPQQSPYFARIINAKHFERLENYLDNGSVVFGGRTEAAELYIEPTILDEITWGDKIMQEEIFGPVLPVMTFDDINNAMDKIRDKPSPLALYIFSEKSDVQQKIIKKVPFGGGCVNDTVAHLGNYNLPFGGLGQSGFGSYHGKRSFDTFSHQKSIMKKTTWFDNPFRYAPYTGKLKWLKKFIA